MIRFVRLEKILICLVLLATMTSTLTVKQAAAADFASGSGTVGNPYIIETPAQLNNVRDNLGIGIFFKLNADIDLSVYANDEGGKGWKPILSEGFFSGTFDGNGHKVTGLYISRSTEDNVGLFGSLINAYTNNMTIKNLSVIGADITGRNNTGIIGGQLQNVSVDQVYATGTVSGNGNVGGLVGMGNASIGSTGLVMTRSGSSASVSGGATIVGGLVGRLYAGSIADSYAEGQVSSSSSSVGGLVGNSGGTITRSYASGNVESGGNNVGGLVGDNTGSISNSFAIGSVIGSGFVGGLVGRSQNNISNSYASGLVTGTVATTKGGFIGGNLDTRITGSYWNTTTSGLNVAYVYSTGIGTEDINGLSSANMRNMISFGGWDFTTVWNIADGISPPYLRSVLPLWLKNLTVTTDTGITQTILPGFDSLGSSYTTTVPSDTSSVTVSGIAIDSNATVTITGGTSLSVGDNTVTVNVTGKNGRLPKSYVITVNKAAAPLSSNNDLSDLKVNGTTVAGFASGTLSYSIGDVPNAVTSVTIAATAVDPVAGVSIENSSGFQVGNNTIRIRVVAQDGTPKEYTITVNRAAFDFAGGLGTEVSPYEIANAAQLNNVRYYLLNKFFKLTANVDLSGYADADGGKGWKPIGTSSSVSFRGTFDGNGHKVTGLTISRSTEDNVGLFGFVSNGTIKNLMVLGAIIIGKDYTGILAGYGTSLSVEQVHTTGTVSGNNNLGGLFGLGNHSTTTKSGSSADVTGFSQVGGLAGSIVGSITDSYAEGQVYGGTNYAVGGLAGSNSGTITTSYASGNVRSNGSTVGGLVGNNSGGSIANSFASGSVQGVGNVGGLIGVGTGGTGVSKSYSSGFVTSTASTKGGFLGFNSNIPITGSYWNTTTSGLSVAYSGTTNATKEITGLTSANMRNRNSFVGWDFTTIWDIADGVSPPYLRNALPLWLKDITITTTTNSGNTSTIIPGFDSLGSNYSTTVPSDTSSVTVSGTAVDSTAVITVSGGTNLNDGANTVTLTVTGASGKLPKSYVITVNKATAPLSGAKEITGFSLVPQTGSATIDSSAHTVSIEVVYGTNLATLTPIVTVSADATVSPVSGVVTDFSSGPVDYTVTAQNGDTQIWVVTVSEASAPLSGANDITGFTLAAQTGTATIDLSAHTVSIEVVYGTNLATLAPIVTVSDNATVSPASGAVTDFSSGSVNYTVTAQNGDTQIWVVTVSEASAPLSGANDITGFTLVAQTGTATINSSAHTVSIEVAYGTNLATLAPIVTASVYAAVSPASGVVTDFSGGSVNYTVTAQNGDTQIWVVTVSEAPAPLSGAKEITGFTLVAQTGTATINSSAHTVSIEVAHGMNLATLAPTVTVSADATVSPVSGAVTDFSGGSVNYTVTAQNGDTQIWVVTISEASVALSSAKDFTSFSFSGLSPTVTGTISGTNIALTVPYVTDVTALVATFVNSPASTVAVNGAAQTSSLTANNYTSPVTYTVTAENGSAQDYTVTVTKAAAPLSGANELTGFALVSQTGSATINSSTHTVSIEVAYGTNLAALAPTLTVSVGATVSPASGAVVDFSGGPVDFTVTAQNGDRKVYYITVIPHRLADDANLTDLKVNGASVTGFTSGNIGPYSVNIPNASTSVSVAYTKSDSHAIVAVAGNTSLNIGVNMITVLVTAEDTSITKTYSITVTRAQSASGEGGNSGSGNSPFVPTTTTNVTAGGKLILPAGSSGEAWLGDMVTVSIPAGATKQELWLTIKEVLDITDLAKDHEVFASSVFEILKNFTDNFLTPVTLTFKFDPEKLKDNQRASVFYYDEQKQIWVEVGGTVDGDQITIAVDHFTKYAVMFVDNKAPNSPVISFSDTIGHWAEANIMMAVQDGMVSGFPDGMFKPNQTVTRAEFAVMLMSALKVSEVGAALHFTDQAKIGAWARTAVAQAVQAGIVQGYADGSFQPDAHITRAELAVMIASASGANIIPDDAAVFADDTDIPVWAKGAVAAVKGQGIISGRGGNRFAPNETATRAEAVTIILEMLKRK